MKKLISSVIVMMSCLFISLQTRAESANPTPQFFNSYILKAVEYLNSNFHMLGYNINGVLSHDIAYLNLGIIPETRKGQEMCVSAQMETMLTAMQIYTSETHDTTPFQYLPVNSWKGYTRNDIRAHIWVDSKLNSGGGADALRNFGMGQIVPFEKLEPGSFINLNRNLNHPSGHAVVFLAFIDINGIESSTYHSEVAGFKYFSSQGKKGAGFGGLSIKDAIFDNFKCPTGLPYPVDCHIMNSKKQKYLNTGMMLAPQYWHHTAVSARALMLSQTDGRFVEPDDLSETKFNAEYFNGETSEE